jgi:hypothetical protein
MTKKRRSQTDLFKRGNYSLLRLLSILSAAGDKGMPTLKLLDEIGSHATYTQNIITKAHKAGLITRELGEPPTPGQFPAKCNRLTPKGRQLLQSQLLGKG